MSGFDYPPNPDPSSGQYPPAPPPDPGYAPPPAQPPPFPYPPQGPGAQRPQPFGAPQPYPAAYGYAAPEAGQRHGGGRPGAGHRQPDPLLVPRRRLRPRRARDHLRCGGALHRLQAGRCRPGMAIAGLVLGALTVVLGIIFWIVAYGVITSSSCVTVLAASSRDPRTTQPTPPPGPTARRGLPLPAGAAAPPPRPPQYTDSRALPASRRPALPATPAAARPPRRAPPWRPRPGARHRRAGDVGDPDRLLVPLRADRDRRPDLSRVAGVNALLGPDFAAATLALVFRRGVPGPGGPQRRRPGPGRVGAALGAVAWCWRSSSFPWRSPRPTPPARRSPEAAADPQAEAQPHTTRLTIRSGTATTFRAAGRRAAPPPGARPARGAPARSRRSRLALEGGPQPAVDLHRDGDPRRRGERRSCSGHHPRCTEPLSPGRSQSSSAMWGAKGATLGQGARVDPPRRPLPRLLVDPPGQLVKRRDGGVVVEGFDRRLDRRDGPVAAPLAGGVGEVVGARPQDTPPHPLQETACPSMPRSFHSPPSRKGPRNTKRRRACPPRTGPCRRQG